MNTQPRVRWARKLAYAARDDGEGSAASYIAMIELRHDRDGPPIAFALYRRVMPYRGEDPSLEKTEIIRLRPRGTWQEMVAHYWLFPPEGTERNQFPGYRSVLWKRTSVWLNRVAAGGWHESGDFVGRGPGQWMRVGTPSRWTKRRKKKPLRFGFPPHVARKLRLEVEQITQEIYLLQDRQNELETGDEFGDIGVPAWNRRDYEEIQDQIDALANERDSLNGYIDRLVEQMRAEVRQKFPVPAGKTPKRELRKQKRIADVFG